MKRDALTSIDLGHDKQASVYMIEMSTRTVGTRGKPRQCYIKEYIHLRRL
jgi:hypothetical protein